MEVWIHIVSLVAISLVSAFMDLQCIGQPSCFESVYFENGYAYLGDDMYILFDVCLQLMSSYPIQPPLHIYFCKVFQPSIFLLISHFKGHLLHTYLSHLSVTLSSPCGSVCHNP
jgi:hypothetical protein